MVAGFSFAGCGVTDLLNPLAQGVVVTFEAGS